MRVPLSAYGPGTGRVYSLVASVPFTPVDFDIGRLARGEWDALTDRFRLWFIPRIEGRDDRPLCHLSVRKFDREADVLVFMHVAPRLDVSLKDGSEQEHFVVGVLCNDDVRARSAIGTLLDIPPAFHRRREVKLIERRWRSDPRAVMFFLANVHSATSASEDGRMVSVQVGGRPGLDVMAALKEGMGGWWNEERQGLSWRIPDQA